jgi:hypothetical protein
MAWFNKKPDPLSDRARALSEEIAQLEAQIKKLDSQKEKSGAGPRLRSTSLPRSVSGSSAGYGVDDSSAQAGPSANDPIFENFPAKKLPAPPEPRTTSAHYNDLGVRKYDLPALFQRLRSHLRRPSTNNPRLVSYLAAGGIQGLRPLRYEKRTARNRFFALVIFLLVLLFGLVAAFVKHN